MFKEIFNQMSATDIMTIVLGMLTLIGSLIKVISMINNLKSKIAEHENKTKDQDAQIKKLDEKFNSYQRDQDVKLEKIAERLGAKSDTTNEKLSLIERDLVQTTSYLKSNFEFLASISKDNKTRIDTHDLKIHELDKGLENLKK